MPVRLALSVPAALAAAVFLLVLASPAGAVVTSTNVTVPANGTVIDPGDLTGGALGSFTVSGTTDAGVVNGDKVDIVCAQRDPEVFLTPKLAVNVSVNATTHTFTTTASVSDTTAYSRCRAILAVPAGSSQPAAPEFTGPTVAINGWFTGAAPAGVNAGKLVDYTQFTSGSRGYMSMQSAGVCGIRDGFLMDPETLNSTPAFNCSQILGPVSGQGIKVDDRPAYLPAQAIDTAADIPGVLPIRDFTHQSDPATAAGSVSSVEPILFCANDSECNSSWQDSSLRIDHTASTSASGRLLVTRDRFVNTTSTTRTLTLVYALETDDSESDLPFPALQTKPGVISFVRNGGTEGTVTKPHLALAWSGFTVTNPAGVPSRVNLAYGRFIPPNSFTTITHAYAMGTTKAEADGLAAGAVAGGLPTVTFDALPGATTETPFVLASGAATDNARVNDVSISGGALSNVLATLSGGTWSTPVPLKEGLNTLTARVTDDEGNTSEATRTITYVKPPDPPGPPSGPPVTPPVIPPVIPPVVISNKFTLNVTPLKAGDAKVALLGSFPGAGALTSTLTAKVKSGKKTKTVTLGTTKTTIRAAAKVKFSIALSKSGKALVAKAKSLKTSLAVVYKPTGGKAATKTIPLTFKVKPPKKKKK